MSTQVQPGASAVELERAVDALQLPPEFLFGVPPALLPKKWHASRLKWAKQVAAAVLAIGVPGVGSAPVDDFATGRRPSVR